MSPLRVDFVLYDGFAATDAVGPADVLSSANQAVGHAHYTLRYVARGDEVRAGNGMRLRTQALPRPAAGPHMLVVPGADEAPLRAALADATLLRWIARTSAAARRTCSVCSGAFLLAQAGVLWGRRATTHWRGVEALRAMFPGVEVDDKVLFTEDRGVWTSAGVTAGVDMALAIVERDLGRDVAMRVAREMVLFLVRPGGQPQFSAPLDLQARASQSDLGELAPWLEARLDRPLTVAQMAEAMSMTERTFHRRCLAVFGLTPLAVLQRLRLERVRALLAEAAMPLKTVAAQSGFGSVSSMGKALRAGFGVSPVDYRRNFGASPVGASDP
jgi:transcriptional regulator GlxA family with amidase domain